MKGRLPSRFDKHISRTGVYMGTEALSWAWTTGRWVLYVTANEIWVEQLALFCRTSVQFCTRRIISTPTSFFGRYAPVHQHKESTNDFWKERSVVEHLFCLRKEVIDGIPHNHEARGKANLSGRLVEEVNLPCTVCLPTALPASSPWTPELPCWVPLWFRTITSVEPEGHLRGIPYSGASPSRVTRLTQALL